MEQNSDGVTMEQNSDGVTIEQNSDGVTMEQKGNGGFSVPHEYAVPEKSISAIRW